jgi:transcriptional regulator with XRE-family HTH domain
MNHLEVRLARTLLGLSVRQMAEYLKTDPQTVRRMELNPRYSTSRTPSPRVEAILKDVLERHK